jgi:hypothetical protein
MTLSSSLHWSCSWPYWPGSAPLDGWLPWLPSPHWSPPFSIPAGWPAIVVSAVAMLVLVPLGLPPLRRALISNRLFGWFKSVLPPMSATEREALDAGTVWWDAELFSGRPRWKTLFDMKRAGIERTRTGLHRQRGRGTVRDDR